MWRHQPKRFWWCCIHIRILEVKTLALYEVIMDLRIVSRVSIEMLTRSVPAASKWGWRWSQQVGWCCFKLSVAKSPSTTQRVFQERICLDNCSFCHTEIEFSDQTCSLMQSTLRGILSPGQPVPALTPGEIAIRILIFKSPEWLD